MKYNLWINFKETNSDADEIVLASATQWPFEDL